MKKTLGITDEDWRAALEDTERRRDDPGQTPRELAQSLSICPARVYAMLRAMDAKGKLVKGRRWTPRGVGMYPVTVYRLKP